MSNKQINNGGPFVFPTGSSLVYPLAPLVTAEDDGSEGVLVRAVVFIDAAFTGTPSFSPWSYDAASKSITGYVDYDMPAPRDVPTNYNSWFLETTYNDNWPVDTIILYLRDTDPKTSRGTVTTVQTGLD